LGVVGVVNEKTIGRSVGIGHVISFSR
jgi:hypothetical protein